MTTTKIGDLFDTRIEEKIEPVIKVGETGEPRKLAQEIGSYVVTPLIERHIDDFLEHYTDTFLKSTTEIGIWISGYFGSGKSHLAKVLALLCGNRDLLGSTACERFPARVSEGSPRKASILRSLARMGQCHTDVLAFNLNTLSDNKNRALPQLLLSEYYKSRGYGGNLIYAKVIESELDRMGLLPALHKSIEARTGRPFVEIQSNLTFYRRALYDAACEVAPQIFRGPEDVDRALREAERGEIYNVSFLVDTILNDLKAREAELRRPVRLLLVLDESGQWIENDAGRLAHLQAFIEEAAIRGQGRLWAIVTTHGDMGSIYKEARALDGDMKKIEGRFRFKPALTTENIEEVLEDRLFKKRITARPVLEELYQRRSGTLRGLGEPADSSQVMPSCTVEKFIAYYPFFPYQVHLIPQIVKSLRSKGGRGEQLSGSTRTLLAITQDILRAGRRPYLELGPGALVSFDEVYGNLEGEGEVSPDVRTELARVPKVVPGATRLTARVAEVLYLLRELDFLPRTTANLARFLAEDVEDELPGLIAKVEPELHRLRQAKLVGRIGEEWEFLTGERRSFEEAVVTRETQILQQDRERGLHDFFVESGGKIHVRKWLDFTSVSHSGREFELRLVVDGTSVSGRSGPIELNLVTPLGAAYGKTADDLASQSSRDDHRHTIFVLSAAVRGFEADLSRYLAMREVIDTWKGDPHRSQESQSLALDRETRDLPKLEEQVLRGFAEGIRRGHLVFRGSPTALVPRPEQKPADALRAELASRWPTLYPKLEKLPVQVKNEQRAIQEVLAGTKSPSADVKDLALYDRAGNLDTHGPLLSSVRLHLSTEQAAGRRVTGADLLRVFSAPPYGWDGNAVRVGVAALVRAGAVKILVGKKPLTDPADPELVDALRVSRGFDRVELVLELKELSPEVVTETRTFLMQLLKRRNIEETPAALSQIAGEIATEVKQKGDAVALWSGGAGLPLPAAFTEGLAAWEKVLALKDPLHRVTAVHESQPALTEGRQAVDRYAQFQTEQGAAFVEMGQLVDQLAAIEHLLDARSAMARLLSDHGTAVVHSRFGEPELWKQLQALRAQAELELKDLLAGWRADARILIEGALARLARELGEVPPADADGITAPLRRMLDTIDKTKLPAQVATLPGRAEQALKALAEVLGRLAPPASQPADDPAPGPDLGHGPPHGDGDGGRLPPTVDGPARPVTRLRLADFSAAVRIGTLADWEQRRDQLLGLIDSQVRRLLAEGHDVELG